MFIPMTFVALLAVVFGERLQQMIWSRLLKQPATGPNGMSLADQCWRAAVVIVGFPVLAAVYGGTFPEARARQICHDCAPLITQLQSEYKLRGIYPTNAVALVKSNEVLRRRYHFYYGRPNTNGVDWTPDEMEAAHVSCFVTTDSFQCVVPIEHVSPVSFSSYYVFSATSEHPEWHKVRLHWSLLGAYIDAPSPQGSP
ncbi:MAG TPA: hypothetical protein VL527_11135 [Dongiaceae bacterium]|nr:hypothetical protein [Dongiaceae bacterium]